MTYEEEIVLHNIEEALKERESLKLVVEGSDFFARELALKGYRTRVLKDGTGYLILAKPEA